MSGRAARGSAARAAGRRVRALLARLEHPTSAFERIVLDAEMHIAALEPRLALLEATPFEGLPQFDQPSRPVEEAVESRRSSRVVELPERVRRDRPASAPAAFAPTRPREDAGPAAASGGHAPAVVLPISARRRGAASMEDAVAHGSAAGSAGHDHAAREAGRRLETAASDTARAADVLERFAREHMAAALPVVRLGAVAQRALDALARQSRAQSAGAAAGAARGFASAFPTLRPGVPSGRTVRPSLLRTSTREGMTATAPGSVRRAAGTEQPAATSAPGPVRGEPDAASRAPATATAVFHFDPLEERRSSQDRDDELAERIGEVLREQARRQGVDLT